MADADNTRTCLVVDDSSAIRRVISGLFRELNYQVAEAPTGVQALDYCRENTPDIVMLDWNMPVMDGITCLTALRTMEFTKRPVVVMCTTESQMSKIQQALGAGADEYIMKPFDKFVLVEKLAQLGLE